MFVNKTRSNKNNEPNKKNLKVKKLSSESDDSEGSAIELEDPCAPKQQEKQPTIIRTPGLDPRFQQQNQTLRCSVMYADFFQCEHLLGEGHEACKWFKDVYMSICPNAWIEQWDEYRAEGRMPWHKKAEFAKAPYGK